LKLYNRKQDVVNNQIDALKKLMDDKKIRCRFHDNISNIGGTFFSICKLG
jgi:hypothetical protein